MNRFLQISFYILLCTACNSTKKSEKRVQKTTQILLPNTYRNWEDKNPADKLNSNWLDLYQKEYKFYIGEANYTVKNGEDECTGSKTKTIISNRKTLLFIDKDSLKMGEINSINFEKNKIWPNEQIVFKYNNLEYTIRAEGDIISTENVHTEKGLERFSEVENYKLYISTNYTAEMLFLEQKSFNDTFVKLLFVGDIDSDGKLDFVFEANRNYEEKRVFLYLSSEAENSKIIKKSSEITIGFGC